MKPENSRSVNWLRVAPLSGESWRLFRSYILSNAWLWKVCSSSLCGLKLFAGSSSFLMYWSPSVLDWRWTFLSPVFDGSSTAICGPELDAPTTSSCPKLDAPVAVVVSLWVSCWRGSSRLESPPALYSDGGTAWQSMYACWSLIFLANKPAQWTGFFFAQADVANDCPARLLTLENKGFTNAEKLTKCFDEMWCGWCWPVVSVVSLCLLWMILLWECQQLLFCDDLCDLNHWI